MFHSFLFLKKLSSELNEILKGATLFECFSQQKDELVLGFRLISQQDHFIKASLDNDINLISFKEEFRRARRNSVDIFENLIDSTVAEVQPVSLDRSFYILFNDGRKLLFKLHGSRSNIILLNKSENLLFKNNLKNDLKANIDSLQKQIEFEEVNEEALDMIEKIMTQGAIQYLKNNSNYNDANVQEKSMLIKGLIKNSNSLKFAVSEEDKPQIVLSESDIQNSISNISTSAIEIANILYDTTVKKYLPEKRKHTAVSFLKKKIKKAESYIQKAKIKRSEIENRRSYEEIANIIMANLHNIDENKSSVVLHDFYEDAELKIKLKKGISPQKNAESYYRKSKNEKKEREKLAENIDSKLQQISSLEKEIERITEMSQLNELNKWLRQNETKENEESKRLPYKSFNFKGNEIRVGKSSRDNDALIMNYAHKDDFWLHARDVPGSHVIIKTHDSKKPDKSVIEYAAGIAAAYSKRKNDSLCPVIFTQRKYVRKSKKMKPGEVRLEREEVIMVIPSSPSD